ncbi:MAG: hypothetical protein EBU90_16145 [Proteobacteria bacterium]|nr:hypothetical protein [Pseudomonadota bacterium]NBP15320.1 hypothetical protein [bacterium]
MAEPVNQKLYNYVKSLANKKFQSKTGIYRSSWIVREYKRRGGKFKGSRPQNSGLKRWFREKWVDLNRPIKNSKGKVIGYRSCGRSSVKGSKEKYPLCRPSHRITSQTPRTYKEISKSVIKKAKRDKSKVRGSRNIKFGGGQTRSQYYGKRSRVMIKVPENVRKWALYAFKLKRIGFQGATETGWRRAKQLATRESISVEDARYMRNWFARHIYTSYPGFKKWDQAGRPKDRSWHRKHAIISWITWAGDAGFRWINSLKVLSQINRYFGTDYKPIRGKKQK